MFWHWRSEGHEPAAYEDALVAFHASLADSPPTGLEGSAAFSIAGAPWIPTEGQGYQDWYLVDDWAALGALNLAAVQNPHADVHRRIAQASAQGVGAVYELQHGEPDLRRAGAARWITKPREVAYADFYATCPTRPGESLWRRQLVLGPAPELCRLGSAGDRLTTGAETLVTPLDVLWASA